MRQLKFANTRHWAAAVLSLLIGSPAIAATFNPTTAPEIQNALDTAAANGQDDTINIPAGTFLADDSGNSSFYYNSSEDFALTIQGAGAGSTILRRESGNSVLEVYNSTGAGTDLTLSGVTIIGAGQYGLANSSGNGSTITVENCDFTNNDTNIFLIGGAGTVNVSNNDFSGGNYGILFSLSNSSATLTNNTLEDMSGNGSALYVGNAPMDLTLQGNTFNNNASDTFGGALDMVGNAGTVTLINNIFSGNSSDNEAGAVNIPPNDQPITVIGNVFYNNSSTGSTTAGALYAEFSDSILLVNNTFTSNDGASGGGGVFLLPLAVTDTTTLYNNIIFGNSGDMADDVWVGDDYGDGAPVVLSHNDIGDFQSVCENDSGCNPNVLRAENISEDPRFIDVAGGNLNLGTGSPAIGTGSPNAPQLPTTDLTGRTLNDPPDMGALAVGSLIVSPLRLDFGNVEVGDSTSLVVTLTNDGANPLAITGMALSNTAAFSLDTSDCGGSTPRFAPGATCDVLVNFEPGSVDGFDGTLTIESSDPTLPSVVVEMSGVGIEDSGGGCSLGAAGPSSAQAAWLLVPLLWAFRRFRK